MATVRKTRHIFQGLFLVLVLAGVFVFRKNLEVWCPFGGVECLSLYLHDGKMLCALGASNFFILTAILLLTLAMKRVFCGYMCPVGTVAEVMRCLAKKCGIKAVEPAPAVDRVLSLLKYVVLAGVLWGTFAATELIARHGDPCFAMIGSGTNEAVPWTAFVVLGLLVVVSLFVSMPFCRWLCPFGAVLNIFSRVGLTRVHRDAGTCINCGRCSKACPMQIEVAKSASVSEARCLTCGECLLVCPVDKTLTWRFLDRRPIAHPGRWIAAAIVLCVAAAVTAARIVPLPTFINARDVERPAVVAEHNLQVEGVTCSGSARQLVFFLDRNDEYAVPGYLRVLTSPGPGLVSVRLQYDPSQTDPNALLDAIVEPYYDAAESRWRSSPFRVEGYDPLTGF